MPKDTKKTFTSYRQQLIDLAKLYGIVEIKKYVVSKKKLTITQLELILLKNKVRLPENRSNSKIVLKNEIKENSIRNVYLSICFLLILGGVIVSRPYIKNIVHEVKFTHVANEYESKKKLLTKKDKNNKIVTKDENKKSEDTISLSAEITKNLFEDLEYDLKGIRNGQKVKPIYLTKLPRDLKTLGNTKEKKDVFIKIILPLILAENERIKNDRDKLFKIINKKFNTIGERVWLKRRFKEYKVENNDLAELKTRMDIIPVSLAIAQAAKESGWGTSRFALEGNALFGQWTWGQKGIVPLNREPDQEFKVHNFQILRASVRAYKNNLNTHNGYKKFRETRAQLRQRNKKITGLDLIKYLENYAKDGKKYVKVIGLIINQNSLTDFDNAILLSTKSRKGLAL